MKLTRLVWSCGCPVSPEGFLEAEAEQVEDDEAASVAPSPPPPPPSCCVGALTPFWAIASNLIQLNQQLILKFQCSFRAVAEQLQQLPNEFIFQWDFANSEQFQSNFGAILEEFQSSRKPRKSPKNPKESLKNSKQLQSNSRAIPEQL